MLLALVTTNCGELQGMLRLLFVNEKSFIEFQNKCKVNEVWLLKCCLLWSQRTVETFKESCVCCLCCEKCFMDNKCKVLPWTWYKIFLYLRMCWVVGRAMCHVIDIHNVTRPSAGL